MLLEHQDKVTYIKWIFFKGDQSGESQNLLPKTPSELKRVLGFSFWDLEGILRFCFRGFGGVLMS